MENGIASMVKMKHLSASPLSLSHPRNATPMSSDAMMASASCWKTFAMGRITAWAEKMKVLLVLRKLLHLQPQFVEPTTSDARILPAFLWHWSVMESSTAPTVEMKPSFVPLNLLHLQDLNVELTSSFVQTCHALLWSWSVMEEMIVAMARMKVSSVQILHLFQDPQRALWTNSCAFLTAAVFLSRGYATENGTARRAKTKQVSVDLPLHLLLLFPANTTNSPVQMELASNRSLYATVDGTAPSERTRDLSVQLHLHPFLLLCATWIISCATTEVVFLTLMSAMEDGTARMEMTKKPSANHCLRKNPLVRLKIYRISKSKKFAGLHSKPSIEKSLWLYSQ